MIEVATMLSGLLSGGEVHTGRVVEVRCRDDDGAERTVRHKEYVKIGGFFYDPPAKPEIAEVLAARVEASA
ncbi:hypothetical protein [Methylobacterium sp. ARG-1]|uniref:hypothetical protein n=1 Tax=Methylobacterium sp. ARG-1 TaxID=1692501 RepID=UPI000680DEA1|nr:hypothetical protein [Methylobacterium sp. ARG-1]KNY20342.1 hypothetical protein AKJ13_22975 [Methylobacterium sp. ARG-1]